MTIASSLPLRRFACLIAVLGLAGCGVFDVVAPWQDAWDTPAREIAYGASIRPGCVLALDGVWDEPTVQDTLTEVGLRLSGQSGVPSFTWEFVAVGAWEPALVTLPGGVCLVSRGFLAQVNDHDELAAALSLGVAQVATGQQRAAMADLDGGADPFAALGPIWTGKDLEALGAAAAFLGIVTLDEARLPELAASALRLCDDAGYDTGAAGRVMARLAASQAAAGADTRFCELARLIGSPAALAKRWPKSPPQPSQTGGSRLFAEAVYGGAEDIFAALDRFARALTHQDSSVARSLWREALPLLEHAIADAPDDLPLALWRARLLRRLGRRLDAREVLRDLERRFPASFWVQYELGLVEAQLGQRQRATLAFETARTLHPQAVGPRFALAGLAREFGNTARAVHLYDAIVTDTAGIGRYGDAALQASLTLRRQGAW